MFFLPVSRDLANCLDRGISLRNRNPCYQKISCDYNLVWNESIIYFGILLKKNGDIVPPLIKNFDFWEVSWSSNEEGFNFLHLSKSDPTQLGSSQKQSSPYMDD